MIRGLFFAFGILATGLAIVFLDQPVAQFFAEQNREHWRLGAREITNIALGEYWFGLAAIVFVFTRFFFPRVKALSSRLEIVKNLERWAIYFFVSLLGTGIILQSLKILIGRQRPHRSEILDPLVFEPLNFNWYYHSLPSGHTQVIFTAAACFALLWPKATWFFYLLAAFIGFTRVVTLQHFLSDFILGAVVGCVGAWWMHSLLQNRIKKPVLK